MAKLRAAPLIEPWRTTAAKMARRFRSSMVKFSSTNLFDRPDYRPVREAPIVHPLQLTKEWT
jgi:hypothetical protein